MNELLQRLNIGEGLTQEQLDQINQIAGLDGTAFLRRGKKLFKANMAENSEEFKQLGNLHKDQRQADYYPQDDSRHFGSKPRGFTKQDLAYDCLMENRVPDNLVGKTLKEVRYNTDEFNKFMMTSADNTPNDRDAFPLTTN